MKKESMEVVGRIVKRERELFGIRVIKKDNTSKVRQMYPEAWHMFYLLENENNLVPPLEIQGTKEVLKNDQIRLLWFIHPIMINEWNMENCILFANEVNRELGNGGRFWVDTEYFDFAYEERFEEEMLQLMNIINDCMRHASNREEFIALMESEGYKVRWEKSRKNITYTTPSGWQCRDRLLFGDKYLKENMEYEFRIREEIIYGRAHGPEPARAFTAADSAGVEFTDHAHCHPVSAAGGSDDADTEDRIHRVGSAWNAGVSSEPEITHRPDSGAEQHGGDPEIVDGDDHSAGTGWEEERKAFLQMAGLASGLRPDRSGQMDRTGTAHRGGTAGDGVWHSDSGQQHPQPVSMKPLHAGLYGLAVTGALLDDGNEDVEERYRRIQAEQEAKNIGAVIGLVAGVAMVLTQDEQSSTEQQWTEDQQAEQTQQQTM